MKEVTLFVKNHWEWLTSFIISFIGILISWRAYRYAKQANQDTHNLINNALSEAIDTQNKTEIENRLLEVAVSEWRLKGEAKTFLKNRFEQLKDKGWTREEFEKIYKQASIQYKKREPKHPLFD